MGLTPPLLTWDPRTAAEGSQSSWPPTSPFQPLCSRLGASLSEADRQPMRLEPSPASSLPACKASVLHQGQGRPQKPSGSVYGESCKGRGPGIFQKPDRRTWGAV